MYGSFDNLFPSVLTVIIVIHSRIIQEPMTTSHGLLINHSVSSVRVLIFLDWYACALLRRDGRWEVFWKGRPGSEAKIRKWRASVYFVSRRNGFWIIVFINCGRNLETSVRFQIAGKIVSKVKRN